MYFGGPPYGIPIPPEIHDQYSDELKDAWDIFDQWWSGQDSDEEGISRASMPSEVREAYDLIRETPIPGFEEDGPTGAESCYMVSVDSRLVD